MSWWFDIADLDEDQKDVIELPPHGNYLILGPPGSGKTNLLLIRAEYLMRTGRFAECIDNNEQVQQIIAALKIQLTAYPEDLLAVAAPRIVDRDFLREHLENSDLSPLILPHRKSGSDDLNRRIYIAHLSEIKGLEFRTIHLGLMQHLHKLRENQKRIAYTAITRAKTTVSIYFTGKIPGYLEQAQAAVEAPKPRPPLEDLFPKKPGRNR